MTSRKTTISSVLSADFGIEDFESGAVSQNFGTESVAAYSLSNKLGLLSPLADRNNTDIVSFGAEAYDLLGEAKQLNSFASNQIAMMNNRFAIATEIKQNYGVEGFNAFAFGCEGFTDAIKNAFTAVVAAIKKIIQSITNWIRQVMNWVGSQIAKGQEKLVEKYKNTKFTNQLVMIKAIVPPSKVSSGTALIAGANETVTDIAKCIAANNKLAIEAIEFNTNKAKKAALKSSTDGINAQLGKAKTIYGKTINVIKLGTASKGANCIVFGTPTPKKIPVSALSYLNKVEWKTILSKDDLKATNDLVRYGKSLIKVLNESLKTADILAKSMKVTGPKDDLTKSDKSLNEAVKANRKAVKFMNLNSRIGSLMAGVLYGTFANYLKLRSYTASAVKALAKAAGGKEPKEGSRKALDAQARKEINS